MRRSPWKPSRHVGPGGHFLAQKHTRKHMRDLFMPQFMDRRPYSEWETKKDDARDWALSQGTQDLGGASARSAGSEDQRRNGEDHQVG